MKAKQIATILTEMYHETTGESAVVQEDLSGVIDGGMTLAELGATLTAGGVDNYVKSLIDRIGKVIFRDTPVYNRIVPSIAVDGFEYGSVLEKIRCEVPDYEENKAWALVKGQTYDPFVFNPPTAEVVFYNNKEVFEIDISITEKQVKESFNSAMEMSRFFAIIENRILFKMHLASDMLAKRILNRLMAEKLTTDNNVVKLLTLYNTANGTDLTAEKAIVNADFLKFANQQIMLYSDYIANPSMLYNNAGYVTVTPKDRQKLVVLSQYERNSEVFMQSDTYHDELVKLQGFETIPYWQGTGNNSSMPLSEISKINVKDGTTEVTGNYIIACLFDKNACALYNKVLETTSQYNAKGRFTNYFHQFEASTMYDASENCVVFTLT